jgi:hypothetical protein
LLPERSLDKEIKLQTPLDLVEVRRQLIAMRSFHSHDPRVTAMINNLLVKFAHLDEPEDHRHAERLQRMIAKTIETVEAITGPRRNHPD